MEIITAISILTAKHHTSHAEKLAAVRRLGTLADLPQNQEAIAAAGGIPPLVALLADASEEMMLEAAHVLAWLAAKCENRQAIIAAGGIEPLVLLLECGTDDAKKEAANALGNLAASPKNSGAIAAAGAIPALVTLAATGSPEAQEEASLALKYLEHDSFCMAVAGAAALLSLPSASPASPASPPSPRSISVKVRAEIEALNSSKEDQKAKAAEQLGTWATVSDENRTAISRQGGVEALVRSLVNGGDQAKWHAARALRNLANNPEAKEAILKADGITTLTLVAKHGIGKVKEAADDALKLFSQQDQPGPVGTDDKCDPIPAAEPAPELPNSMSGVSAADAKSEPEPAPELPNSMSGVSAADAKTEPTATAEPAPELPDSKSGVSAADAKTEPTETAEPAPELPVSKSGVSAADAKSEPTARAEPAPELPDSKSGVSAADAKSEPTATAEPAPELPDSKSGVSAADAKTEPTATAEPAPELPDSKSGVSAADAKSEPTATAEPAPELPDSKSGVSAADAKSEPTATAEPAPELPPDPKSCPAAVADANTEGGAREEIPTGEGTRVAMFSARFDNGPIEKKFRKVFQILLDCHYDVLMVDANLGQSFANLTTKYLWRLKREQGTLLAVCTKHYGEMTASAYSSHKELAFALDYERFVKVLPLKVENTYPPEPPGGPEHEYDKDHLAQAYIDSVIKPGVVYLDCQDKSERQIAVEIAQYLQRHRVGTPD